MPLKTDARFMQDCPNLSEVLHTFLWSLFPNLKQYFNAYHFSEVSDCIFEIPQL